ncbi:unnamed protein product [Pleuronectes platessa]|uniref:DnaJ homolog subfamily C member 22 n=1 Tax=Pleuronectes platessa TaxID=8262 RepID=A0A9N7ULW1_PLEPL|nr:unnamed protein product [Pleuronectes platessa]
MGKSVMVAYALWAVGGPLGLHHLYLGRDSHALLWILTLGGFGFGWVREFTRIPAYIGEANRDADSGRRRPSALVPPPGCICLAASVTAAQHRRFKPPRTQQRPEELGPRLYKLGLAWLAFSAPLGYCIFHNTTATLYYLSDCVSALLDIFWGYYEEAWRKVLEILLKEYTEEEKEALHVLSLEADATLAEITQSYRELVKTWHPDHNPSSDAEATFIKIQEAYEVLLRRHKPRPPSK